MFVRRDSQGNIIAVSVYADAGFDEQLSEEDQGLRAFMQLKPDESALSSEVPGGKTQLLQGSDSELARVLEDIIDLLIGKGVFQFTELPPAAQQKLLARKNLRLRIRKLDLLGDDDEDMLP